MKELSNDIDYCGNNGGLVSAMFNHPDIAFIIIDTNGIIRTFSKGAEYLTGYKCSEVINNYTPVIFFKKTLVSADISEESLQAGVVFKSFIASVLSSAGTVERFLYKKNKDKILCSVYIELLSNDDENAGYLMTLTKVNDRIDTSEKAAANISDESVALIAASIADLSNSSKRADQIVLQHYLFNVLMDNLSDHVYFKNKESRFIRINKAHARWFGLENPLDANGYSDADFFAKEHAEKAYADEQEIIRTGKPMLNIIEKETWQDGKETWASTSKMPLYDTDGSMIGTFGISKNVTPQKIAEEALINHEKRFQSFARNATDIVTILDIDGKIKYESPSFYRIFGYRVDEVLGRNAFEFVHPDDLKEVLGTFNKLLHTKDMVATVTFRFRDVHERWMYIESVGCNLIHDEAISGVVINSKDITDRKKAEIKIEEKSQILNGILDNMPVIVFRIDKNNILTESLGAGLQRLRLKENQVVGLNVFDIYPQAAEYLKTGLEKGYVEYSLNAAKDDQALFFKTFMFEDQHNPGGSIGFTLDITESKLAEKKLKEYFHTLERTNKELDQLAYVVSHDLKAPLRAIFNLSQWIEEDIEAQISEESKKNMALLRGRVQRMKGLINALAEYANIGKKELLIIPVNVNNLLTEIVAGINPPPHITVNIQPDMPFFNTKRLRLKQVFYYLIHNAITHHDKEEGMIDITFTASDDYYQFSIADNGPGIAAEYHEKIFKIFQRLEARDQVEGIGIGLTMVRKILEEQGGEVWLKSEPARGATFTFSWPKPTPGKIQE